jgi:hypothetical protein
MRSRLDSDPICVRMLGVGDGVKAPEKQSTCSLDLT